jgi:hypothetical protein
MTDEEEVNLALDEMTLVQVPFEHDLAWKARRFSRSGVSEGDRLYRHMRTLAKKLNALPEPDRIVLGRVSTNEILFTDDPEAMLDATIQKALLKHR